QTIKNPTDLKYHHVLERFYLNLSLDNDASLPMLLNRQFVLQQKSIRLCRQYWQMNNLTGTPNGKCFVLQARTIYHLLHHLSWYSDLLLPTPCCYQNISLPTT